MEKGISIKRTNSNDEHFQGLVRQLDHELWNELNEDQAQYDQYNKVPDLPTVVVLYVQDEAAAIGCFKKYNADTAEIKRMFVRKEYRGKGFSKLVLHELENWAIECGFNHALLETSIHFKQARNLYANAGYQVIANYDQYAGLDESVCMKKELRRPSTSFAELNDIEYFDFEEDFVEEGIRCIPMIVRYKLDKAGIKLKLSEWAKLKEHEKKGLAVRPAETKEELIVYRGMVAQWIKNSTGENVTRLVIDPEPAWDLENAVPWELNEKANMLGCVISNEQWKALTTLQRFALLKLCKPGHENRNFPIALKEFGLK